MNLDVLLKSKRNSYNDLNINSLKKKFIILTILINELELEFYVLGISESRILKSQSLNTNVSLRNYVIEQTSAESTAGGALLYINKRYYYLDFAIYLDLVLALPFISENNLNLFLLKLLYPRKIT